MDLRGDKPKGVIARDGVLLAGGGHCRSVLQLICDNPFLSRFAIRLKPVPRDKLFELFGGQKIRGLSGERTKDSTQLEIPLKTSLRDVM